MILQQGINVTITFLAWVVRRFAKSAGFDNPSFLGEPDLYNIQIKINKLTNFQLMELFEVYQTTTGE